MNSAARARIRAFRDSDSSDLYDVCVRTADDGGDATGRYDADRLMGDLFAAPYAVLQPLTANTAARAFYDRLGFVELDVPDAGVLTYLGRSTAYI